MKKSCVTGLLCFFFCKMATYWVFSHPNVLLLKDLIHLIVIDYSGVFGKTLPRYFTITYAKILWCHGKNHYRKVHVFIVYNRILPPFFLNEKMQKKNSFFFCFAKPKSCCPKYNHDLKVFLSIKYNPFTFLLLLFLQTVWSVKTVNVGTVQQNTVWYGHGTEDTVILEFLVSYHGMVKYGKCYFPVRYSEQ
jgi:hypothetical protein